MHEAKKTLAKDMRFFAEDVNNKGIKRYYLFTSSALETLIKEYQAKGHPICFYEIMPSTCCTYPTDKEACEQMLANFGTRLYLDVEFPDNADFNMHEGISYIQIGSAIAAEIQKYLEETFKCSCELIVLKSHRKGKFSWHMIAKTFKDGKEYLFKDSLSILTVINNWFDTADLDKFIYFEDDVEKNAIDVGVYTTHRLYRTIHSSKFGKKMPLEFATYFPVRKNPDVPTFEDTLCLQTLENRELYDIEASISSSKLVGTTLRKRKRNSPTEKVSRRKYEITPQNMAAEMFFSNWGVWGEMKKFLVKEWPLIEFEKTSFKSITLLYIPLDKDFRCPENKGSGGNGQHRSNHGYLLVRPKLGTINWKCHDKQCQGTKIVRFPFQLCNKLRRIYTHRYCVKVDKL